MSKKLNDHIDKMFKDTFSGHLTEGKESSWDELNKRVRWNNFLQFGFKHFNIYYSLFIGIFLLGTLLILFNNNLSDKKVNSPDLQMKDYNLEEIDSVKSIKIKTIDTDSIDIIDQNISKPNFRKKRSLKNKKNRLNQVKSDSIQFINNNKNITDTSITKQDTTKTGKGVVVVKPIKKKIIIVPSDVVKKDTVVTYQKKWFRWLKRKK